MPGTASPNRHFYDDLDITCDVYFDGGEVLKDYGIRYHYTKQGGYGFTLVGLLNAYTITKWNPDGTGTDKFYRIEHDVINRSGHNKIRILSIQGRTEFFVNDNEIGSLRDSDFREGRVYLDVWGDETKASFDNLSIVETRAYEKH